jgi:tRNA A-37 threonylcarbamoyl transferase component Bud32
MTCCPSHAQLVDYLAGTLSAAQDQALEAHVAGCAECKAELQRLAHTTEHAAPATPTDGAEGQGKSGADSLDRLRRLALPQTITQTGPATVRSTVAAPEGYAIDCELGQGGMGVVYKARHLALKRTVALKMILVGRQARESDRARFRSEAEAVARLQHPNIVQIHEVGECNGVPFCALEFVEGGSLAQRLLKGPLPAREAARLVQTLAEAMHLAHSRNVVHRDLKPANVLLTAAGVPKVTDFGLAKQMDADSGQTETGAIMGTPSYMAPEQTRGKSKEISPAADVYALGAILYEGLTGQPPFAGASVLDTLEQVRTREPVPPRRLRPAVPRDLETVCLKCLRKEPEARYASAQELADDLGRFLRGEPVLARPLSWPVHLVKWARRRPAVAALLLTLLVLFAAGGWEVLSRRLQADADRIAKADADLKRAQEKEQAEKELREKLEDQLAEGWLRPVGDDSEPMKRSERDVFWDMACSSSDRVRLRFIEKGLETPETAVRLSRRPEEVAHAAVGLNRARRDRVTTILVERLRDDKADREVQKACISLGLALETKDGAFRQEATKAVTALLPTTDPAALVAVARSVKMLAPAMSPAEAATAASNAFDALARVSDPSAKVTDSSALTALVDAVVALAPRMDPQGAAMASEAAGKFLVVMGQTTVRSAWFSNQVGAALRALARRMGPAAAAALAGKARDVMNKTADAQAVPALGRVVAALASRMDPGEAANVSAAAARKALDTGANLKETDQWGGDLPDTFRELAPYLGPKDAAEIAGKALDVIVQSSNPMKLVYLKPAIMQTLVADFADRMSPEDATAAFGKVLDAMGQTRPPYVVSALAGTLPYLADRMKPEATAAAAARLLDILPTQRVTDASYALGLAMKRLAGRMGPDEVAATGAKALDMMAGATDANAVAALASAVAALAARMVPEAAARASAAALRKALGAMPGANDYDTTRIHHEAVVALAALVYPEEAAVACGNVLEGMTPTAGPAVVSRLAMLIVALADRMKSQEAREAAKAAAEKVLDAFGRTTDVGLLDTLARALSSLAAILTPEDATDLCSAALGRLVDAIPKAANPGALHAMPNAIAGLTQYLQPRDAATAAGQALDAMTRAPKQETLSTLAAVVAVLADRMESEDVAAVAGRLLKVVGQAKTKDVLSALAPALAAVATRFGPKDAGATTAKLLDSMANSPDFYMPWEFARPLAALAARMDPADAAVAASRLLELLAKAKFPPLGGFTDALEALAARMEAADAAVAAGKFMDMLANAPKSERPNDFSQEALTAFAAKLAAADLVELLKRPTCLGRPRMLLLNQLRFRCGPQASEAANYALGILAAPGPSGLTVAPLALYDDSLYPLFADQWQALEWLREHRPDLDFAAPARRTAQ